MQNSVNQHTSQPPPQPERNPSAQRAEELRRQLHEHFSDPGPDTKPGLFNDPQPKQIEILGSERERSYRYDSLISSDAFRFAPNLEPAGRRQWPGMNLGVEIALAQAVNSLLGGLAGKTTIQLRPEYHPFFGIQAAGLGAKSILLDSREVPHVEQLIRGTSDVSVDGAIAAEQRARDLGWRIDPERPIDAILSSSHTADLLPLIARARCKIDERVWNNLSLEEQQHNILVALREICRDSEPFYGYDYMRTESIEPAAYMIRALEVMGPIGLRSSLISALRYCDPACPTSDDVGNVSLLYHHIYSRFLHSDIRDSRFVEKLHAVMCQTADREAQQAALTRLCFKYGHTLEDAAFDDHSIDVICCGWGLDFLENAGDFIRHASRLLTSDGLLAGYVKVENAHGARRDLRTPEKLSRFLSAAGFSHPVLIAEEPLGKGIVSNIDRVGITFFARPDAETASSSAKNYFFSPPATSLFESSERTPLSQYVQRPIIPIEPIRQQGADLAECCTLLTRDPEGLSSLMLTLFGEDFSPLGPEDCANVVLTLRGRALESDICLPDELDRKTRDGLAEYLQQQKQVYGLLSDVSSFVSALNRSEQTGEIEDRLCERGVLLGLPALGSWLRGIKSATSRSALSAEATDQLQQSIASMTRELEDRGELFRLHRRLERKVESLHALMLDQERGEAFLPAAILLQRYFLDQQMWCHLQLDTGARIVASLGTIEQRRQFDFTDERSLYVYERLASDMSHVGVCMATDDESDPLFAVFLVPLGERACAIREAFAHPETLSPLLKQQWEGDETTQQILEALCHAVSAHEMAHLISSSETIAAFMQIAYGRAPYETVRIYLDLAVQGKSDFISNALSRGRASDLDRHVAAGSRLTATLLHEVLTDGSLTSLQEERIKLLLRQDQNGFWELTSDRAQSERPLIEETLALLGDERMRRTAHEFLRMEDAPLQPRASLEITVPLPLPDIPSKQSLPTVWRPFLSKPASSNSAAILEELLSLPSGHERLDAFRDLARNVAAVAPEDAVKLIEAVDWSYGQAIAYLTVARALVARDEPSAAIGVLERADRLLAPVPTVISPIFPYYSEFGEALMVYADLMSLKLELRLTDQVRDVGCRVIQCLNTHELEHPRALNLLHDTADLLFRAGDSAGGRDAMRTLSRLLQEAAGAGSFVGGSWDEKIELLRFMHGPPRIRKHALSTLMIKHGEKLATLEDVCDSAEHRPFGRRERILMEHWIERIGTGLGTKSLHTGKSQDYEHLKFGLLQYDFGLREGGLKNIEAAIARRRELSEQRDDYAAYEGGFLLDAVTGMLKHDELLPRALQIARSINNDFKSRAQALRAFMHNRIEKFRTADGEARARYADQARDLASEAIECSVSRLDKLVLENIREHLTKK